MNMAEPGKQVKLMSNIGWLGYYPKLKTKNFPNGLKFINGVCAIYESDFEELQKNDNFVTKLKTGEFEVVSDNKDVGKAKEVKVVKGPVTTASE